MNEAQLGGTRCRREGSNRLTKSRRKSGYAEAERLAKGKAPRPWITPKRVEVGHGEGGMKKTEKVIPARLSVLLYNRYAEYYLDACNNKKAVEYAEKALVIDEVSFWGNYFKGMGLYRLKQYQEASTFLSVAIEMGEEREGIDTVRRVYELCLRRIKACCVAD